MGMVQCPTSLKVTADIARNRLYFTIAGNLSKKDYEKLYTDVRFGVADLKPGFDVISDLRNCILGHLSGITTLQKIMNYLITSEVGEIVRVVEPDSLIFKQAVNLAAKVQGYKPVYVSSLEEAEALLAKAVKRNGLRFHLHRHEIVYKINGQEWQGRLVNISTSGCAVEAEQKQDLMNREVVLGLSFARQGQAPLLFDIQAQVVREEGNVFAVKFINLNSPEKEQLWECLLYEAQREF
jgi:PilZ domain